MSVAPPPSPRPSGAYGGGGFYQQLQPNRKVLAVGLASNVEATVYTVPARTQTEITSIHFDNIAVGAQTLSFKLRLNATSTAYEFHSEALGATTPSAANETLAGMRIMLSPGNELRLVASAINSFNYLITGIEWTLPGGGATA